MAEVGGAGIAFSGGGIIAMLASACQLQALQQLVPNITSHEICATSGGIVGSVLMASTKLGFPPSWSPSDYGTDAASTLSQRFHSDGAPWVAAVTDLLQPLMSSTAMAMPNSSHWWEDVLGLIGHMYGLQPAELRAYETMTATVTILRESLAPLQRDSAGLLPNATGNLIPSTWHPSDGYLRTFGSGAAVGPSAQPVPILTALAYGTSFWAASLLESRILYEHLSGLLPSLPPPDDSFLLVDGGSLDSTAIAALLRRNVSRGVAFYDNSFDLRAVSTQLGFLFGVANTTSDLAMWQGPQLAQVFATKLWPEVFANLTDPEIGAARLDNVFVMPNTFLGISGGYWMSTLLIITTQQSEAFLRQMDEVDGGGVRAQLHPGWPEAMPLPGMTPLDANTLCVYSGWGVMRARDAIQDMFAY